MIRKNYWRRAGGWHNERQKRDDGRSERYWTLPASALWKIGGMHLTQSRNGLMVLSNSLHFWLIGILDRTFPF
jgi:hypothetical protein